MDVIPDERTLMHAESVSSSNAHPHQAHTLFPPIATHTYLLVSFAGLRFHGCISGRVYTRTLSTGILCMVQAGMYRTAHSLLFSHKHAASWGSADGWAQPATCRRLPAHHGLLSGRLSPVLLNLAHVRAGHLTVTHCPGTTTDKCNKTSKECAMSSANTDTLCVWECAKLSHDDKF